MSKKREQYEIKTSVINSTSMRPFITSRARYYLNLYQNNYVPNPFEINIKPLVEGHLVV